MWKVVTSFNLNLSLKLFFYSPILTNNNLLLKIYCEKYYGSIFQLGFFIFYIVFLPFISFSSTFHFFFSFFFFLFFSSTQVSSPPYFIFFFTSRTFQHLTFVSHERERERERERGLGLHRISTAARRPPHHQAGSDQIVLFFSFSFFSYLLVLIQFYFKNWILFCVWINYFAHEQVSLFSLFSFFFFLISFGL